MTMDSGLQSLPLLEVLDRSMASSPTSYVLQEIPGTHTAANALCTQPGKAPQLVHCYFSEAKTPNRDVSLNIYP